MVNKISTNLTMINNELKWIINMNGDPGVLNISALLAKNGAIPLSPQTPINITSAPNIIIGLAGIAASSIRLNVPVAAKIIAAPPKSGKPHIIAIKPYW